MLFRSVVCEAIVRCHEQGSRQLHYSCTVGVRRCSHAMADVPFSLVFHSMGRTGMKGDARRRNLHVARHHLFRKGSKFAWLRQRSAGQGKPPKSDLTDPCRGNLSSKVQHWFFACVFGICKHSRSWIHFLGREGALLPPHHTPESTDSN